MFRLAVLPFMRFLCVMIDHFFFVFFYLPSQFIYKAVDGRIHVFFSCVSVYRTAVYAYCCFCLMS